MQKKTAIEKQLGNIQSMKLRFLFEAGFNLLFFRLNFGFCLRVAYIRENTVFLNVFLGYITEHCFFLIKVGTEERFCGRKLFLERVYIEVIQRKPLQYSNRSAITNLFLMIISLGRCSLTSVYFSDF